MGEFERALPRVLMHEGGYVNDPQDPGGETNRGITKRVYDAYRQRMRLPVQSVKNITSQEVAAIYRANYWDLAKCDQLPAGVSYVVFDGNVNSGVSQSIKWLQRAVGVVPDGVIGNATLAAVQNYGDMNRLVDAICDRRLAFLKALKTWKRFGKGWAARVADVRATGKAWANGSDATQKLPVLPGNAKAFLSDAKPAPALAIADATTGGGIGSGGLAATLQQVQDQLSPYSYGSSLIGKVVVALIVIGAALTVGGLAYRWWAARRKAERADALDLQVTANAQAAA